MVSISITKKKTKKCPECKGNNVWPTCENGGCVGCVDCGHIEHTEDCPRKEYLDYMRYI